MIGYPVQGGGSGQEETGASARLERTTLASGSKSSPLGRSPIRAAVGAVMCAVLAGSALGQRTQLQSFEVELASAGPQSIQSGKWLLNFTAFGTVDPMTNTLELFERTSSGWEFMSAPDVSLGQFSGSDLSGAVIDMDDGWIALGARRARFAQGSSQGLVLLFGLNEAGVVVAEQRIDPLDSEPTLLGRSVSIDGPLLAIGATTRDSAQFPNVGEVLIYERVNNTWSLRQILAPGPGTVTATSYQFGLDVFLDGDRLFVSANMLSVGAVHVFRRDQSGMFVETQILTEPNATSQDHFGTALDVSGDLLLCGKHRNHDRTGRAVLYRHDPVSDQWQRIEEFRSHLPSNSTSGGNNFGRAVGIEGGVVVIGDGNALGTGGTPNGALFVYRPNSSGSYPTTASEVLRVTDGFDNGLGAYFLDYQNGIVSTVAAYNGTANLETVFTFSVGHETDFHGASNGVSNSGLYLDTFIDEDAGLAPTGGPRRGVILSGAPTGTRYLVLGALQGDPAGSGALFGLPGLCLVPPFVRVTFGVVGGDHQMAITGANDLPLLSDRFLSVGGTVYLQGICAPPPGMGGIDWTNGIELTL